MVISEHQNCLEHWKQWSQKTRLGQKIRNWQWSLQWKILIKIVIMVPFVLGRETERPVKIRKKIMSDEHKMTRKDKLVLGITLASIFLGVFVLGLIGLIINLSS